LFNSPAEKKRFEELKMCLYRAQKGLLVFMKPAEGEEMVLGQFQSIWKARDPGPGMAAGEGSGGTV
jgi:hypothetical protein